MSDLPRATPFHGRAAALNPFNRWTARNGFTLAADYGDADQEVLAARTRVVMADISWRWRFFVKGAQAAQFMSRLVTRDVSDLNPGEAIKALWLNDSGAVRGAGVIARCASDSFFVASSATDAAWFRSGAPAFNVTLQDMAQSEGGVALVGPYAAAVLTAAGLDADIVPLGFRKLFWRGLDITISRWGEQNGYEVWCPADDCYLLWDRLMRAGASFGIEPAGLSAMDVLDIQAGVPRPARDYLPAKDGFAIDPSVGSLALESLIDEKHLTFNGRAAWLENHGRSKMVLVGVEIESETPTPFTTLMRHGTPAGHTLASVYSPVLRCAIALAQVERPNAAPGTVFTVTIPSSLEAPEERSVAARVAKLPFVEAPDSISPEVNEKPTT
jgi:glycine cleavage system aminomethyltransferase T